MATIQVMNFAAFDLNLLRVFDALMRERSVTRAGEQIGLSQPAVSSALNRLRALLDDQLLVRRGAEMIPTPRAEAMAPAVREALAQVEHALAGDAAFDPATAERTYTVLGSDFFSTLLVPRLAGQLARRAPKARLRMVDTAYGDIERLLAEDVIDIALEPRAAMAEWVSTQLLFVSDFKMAAARGHAALAGMPGGGAVSMEVYCALRHVIRATDGTLSGLLDDALASQGRERRVVMALPNFQGVAVAVSQGDLVAALPREFADAVAASLDLELYELPIQSPRPEICMYWHRRHDNNPAHRWLREQVAELAAQLVARPRV